MEEITLKINNIKFLALTQNSKFSIQNSNRVYPILALFYHKNTLYATFVKSRWNISGLVCAKINLFDKFNNLI